MTELDVSQVSTEIAQEPDAQVRTSQDLAEIAQDNTAPILTTAQAATEIAFDNPSPLLVAAQIVAEIAYRVFHVVEISDGVTLADALSYDNPPVVALSERSFSLNVQDLTERAAGFKLTLPPRVYTVQGVIKP